MRSWLSWLLRERLLEFAVALTLGTALASLADKLIDMPVGVLAQHVGRNPYGEVPAGVLDSLYAGQLLNFSVGETVIVYGQALADSLALVLVALVAVVVVRRRDRELGVCPFCASRIPHESRHCAYCGSSVAPSDP